MLQSFKCFEKNANFYEKKFFSHYWFNPLTFGFLIAFQTKTFHFEYCNFSMKFDILELGTKKTNLISLQMLTLSIQKKTIF